MSLTLSDDDRRAVDLLMHQRDPSSGATSGFGPVLSASVAQRLDAVEQIVGLLDALPAIEPPKDLVGRTMDRIIQATPSSGLKRNSSVSGGTNATTSA